jgi:putative transposase
MRRPDATSVHAHGVVHALRVEMHGEHPVRAVGDRGSSRLPKYDYASAGTYFVTVCARDMECLFGSIGIDGNAVLTECGQIVETCWLAIPEHFSSVTLDTWITMPNHLHGILIVRAAADKGDACVEGEVRVQGEARVRGEVPVPGEACLAPTNVCSVARGPRRRSIGAIIGSFKSAVSKQMSKLHAIPRGAVWQRNYYEHIVRDEDDLRRVRRYIAENPSRWALKYSSQCQGEACLAPTNVLSRTSKPARQRE